MVAFRIDLDPFEINDLRSEVKFSVTQYPFSYNSLLTSVL